MKERRPPASVKQNPTQTKYLISKTPNKRKLTAKKPTHRSKHIWDLLPLSVISCLGPFFNSLNKIQWRRIDSEYDGERCIKMDNCLDDLLCSHQLYVKQNERVGIPRAGKGLIQEKNKSQLIRLRKFGVTWPWKLHWISGNM